MDIVTVPSGRYAGRQAKVFQSEADFVAAQAQGVLSEGDIWGFSQDVRPGWTKDGATYNVFMSATGEIAVVAPYSETLNWQIRSFHELPDPGWEVDFETNVVRGPSGEVYAFVWPGWLIALVIACVAIAVVTIVITIAIVFVLGELHKFTVSRSQQISDTVALISYANGSAQTIDKNTGETLGSAGPLIDFSMLMWIVIAAIGVFGAIVVIELVTKGRSQLLETTTKGAEKTLGLVERGAHRTYEAGRSVYRRVAK